MNKHDTDTIALAFGLGFLAFVAWWLLVRSVDIEPPTFGWFVGGALIALGALGVAATLRSRDRRTPADTATHPEIRRS